MRTHHQHLRHPHTIQQHFRLEAWHRRLLYCLVAALLVSGLGWLLAHFFLRIHGEFGDMPHPAEHWSMQVHGALILPLAFVAGSLLLQHMRRAHRAGRNRNSGWSLINLLLWLALSGYGLYYLASDSNRSLWSMAHWIAGLLLPAVIWLHIRLGRRAVARRHPLRSE